MKQLDFKQAVENYSLTIGGQHAWSETLQLNFSAGARYTKTEVTTAQTTVFSWDGQIDERQEETDASWGFVGAFDISYADEKMRLSLSGGHDLVPASGRNGLAQRTSAILSLNRRISEELSVYGTGRAFKNRSDRADSGTDLDEYTLQCDLGVRYALNARWRIGSLYRLTWIDDRQADNERRQNVIALVIDWNWPVWE